MAFQKGKSGNPKGREKGSTNRNVANIREMILQSLVNRGGIRYLDQLEDKYFAPLVGKVLPVQLAASTDGVPVVRIFAKPPSPEGQVIEATIEKKGDE